jgi:hypothetical protein
MEPPPGSLEEDGEDAEDVAVTSLLLSYEYTMTGIILPILPILPGGAAMRPRRPCGLPA